MTKPPPNALFVVNPSIGPETSAAPEEIRASEDEDYYAEQGFDVFPWEIADEGGPDGSAYLMGAQWEGVTHVARQGDDMRDGYFISTRQEGPWKWVLWRCTWDDNYSAWSWEASGATSWDTKDPAAAGREMVLRLWQSWRDQGPPSDTDYRGLLDGEAVADLVAEAFRPKRRPRKNRTPPTDSTTPPEPQTTTPSEDTFMALLGNLASRQVPLAAPDEGKGQWTPPSPPNHDDRRGRFEDIEGRLREVEGRAEQAPQVDKGPATAQAGTASPTEPTHVAPQMNYMEARRRLKAEREQRWREEGWDVEGE